MDGGLACFWCTEPFPGIPLHCPIKKLRNGTVICTDLVFCGFPCAKAHVLRDFRPAHDGHARLELLQALAKKNGYVKVVVAPPRQALSKFGGPMSLEDFRGARQQLEIDPPGMLPIGTSFSHKLQRCDHGEPAVPTAQSEQGFVLQRKKTPAKRAQKITVWLSR